MFIVTLIFIGRTRAQIDFLFRLSLSGVPSSCRVADPGTQMFRNMMRKGTSYPGQKRRRGEEALEHVADDEEAPPNRLLLRIRQARGHELI